MSASACFYFKNTQLCVFVSRVRFSLFSVSSTGTWDIKGGTTEADSSGNWSPVRGALLPTPLPWKPGVRSAPPTLTSNHNAHWLERGVSSHYRIYFILRGLRGGILFFLPVSVEFFSKGPWLCIALLHHWRSASGLVDVASSELNWNQGRRGATTSFLAYVFLGFFVFFVTKKCVYVVLSLHVEFSHIILYVQS